MRSVSVRVVAKGVWRQPSELSKLAFPSTHGLATVKCNLSPRDSGCGPDQMVPGLQTAADRVWKERRIFPQEVDLSVSKAGQFFQVMAGIVTFRGLGHHAFRPGNKYFLESYYHDQTIRPRDPDYMH